MEGGGGSTSISYLFYDEFILDRGGGSTSIYHLF